MKGRSKTYEEALLRLEEIVKGIERGDFSIDVLAERLEEAQKLIKDCKDKIYATDKIVRQILDEPND